MGRETHNLPFLRAYRRALRTGATPAERRLWRALRRRQLDGWRWRRQYSIGPFIVDFFCPAARLVIELDGGVHRDPVRADYDARRQRWFEAQGIRVIRFANEEVATQLEVVVEAVRWALAEASAPPGRAGGDDARPPPGLPPPGGGDARGAPWPDGEDGASGGMSSGAPSAGSPRPRD